MYEVIDYAGDWTEGVLFPGGVYWIIDDDENEVHFNNAVHNFDVSWDKGNWIWEPERSFKADSMKDVVMGIKERFLKEQEQNAARGAEKEIP